MNVRIKVLAILIFVIIIGLILFISTHPGIYKAETKFIFINNDTNESLKGQIF